MNFALFVQLCGIPLLVVMLVLASILTVVAFYLTFAVRRVVLLVAFLPLTLLPIMAGVVSALVGTVGAVGMQIDPSNKTVAEPGFLMLMNMVPLLTGTVAAIPPAVVAIVGRWTLTWRAAGVTLLPRRQEEGSAAETDGKQLLRDTDDYLERLVRPR
jgi:hypothetical protein